MEQFKISDAWLPIDSAPLGVTVFLWHRSWRHSFPGKHIGDGAVCIDTCEPVAAGWTGHASHWMRMTKPKIVGASIPVAIEKSL